MNKILPIIVVSTVIAVVVGVNIAMSESKYTIMTKEDARWCIDILENGL